MSWRLVRLNTPDHGTRELAFGDMVAIIERGYYWKQAHLPDIPVRTQIIGMGSHGGRGLFIVGVTTSDQWENEPDGDIFKHRLPVAWARVIYENTSMLDAIKCIPDRFNERFGADLTHEEYREILALVLAGESFDMDVDQMSRSLR
jgi:hypothetical protein